MNKTLKTVIVAVVVAAAGYGGYKSYNHNNSINMLPSELQTENVEALSAGGEGNFGEPSVSLPADWLALAARYLSSGVTIIPFKTIEDLYEAGKTIDEAIEAIEEFLRDSGILPPTHRDFVKTEHYQEMSMQVVDPTTHQPYWVTVVKYKYQCDNIEGDAQDRCALGEYYYQ
ncbi:MAG: hypothetical protein K5874_08640 [Bacteroidaceae bacterium]|nr:hypothetical protein [Bacteroidaceae bacterium]